MKLLPRKEIDVKVALQRKGQIDEGVRIAEKVDKLRETFSQEEAKLQQFREGMIKQITEDIAKAKEEHDLLLRENESIKEEGRILRLAVDKNWEEHKGDSRLEMVSSLEKVLQQKLDDIKVREEKSQDKLDKAKEALQRVKVRERELDRRIFAIDEIKKQTENIYRKAIENSELNEQEIQRRTMELTSKEAKVQFDSEANENFKEILIKKEIELSNREKAVTDRYETLLRTINRLKK